MKAVIFDCDGVLVDSELVSCTAAVATLKAKGIRTDLAEIQTLIGKSNQELLAYFKNRGGLEINQAELDAEIEENYFRLADDLKPMPGIVALLDKLTEAGLPLAVASSGGHRKIQFSLEKTGLKKYFPVICSAVDVLKGKPEPDLFLYAANKLDKKPGDCIVVEDSLYGIMAAKKAGMFALAYPSSFSGEELYRAGADLVIKSFEEFLNRVVLD